MAEGTLARQATAVAGTLTNAAEGVVATLTAPSSTVGLQNIILEGTVTLLTGATTTGVTLRVRRTSLTGALVGVPNVDGLFAAAAGGIETHSIAVQDNPGETAGQVYVLTAQQIGGSANGTVQQAALKCTMGPG